MEISYTVVGLAKPQARPKVFHKILKNGKPFIHTYSPKSDWFGLVYTESLKQKQKLENRLAGALELILVFCLPIPLSVSKKKRAELHYVSKRPDLDNLAKAVMDAINNVGLWEDDSQVAHLDVKKIYSDEPRCLITIREVV